MAKINSASCLSKSQINAVHFRELVDWRRNFCNEHVCIIPGTFPKPISKIRCGKTNSSELGTNSNERRKSSDSSGFKVYIRPPFPIYRVQCKEDSKAIRLTKTDPSIRRLYKSSGAAVSSNGFKDNLHAFRHSASIPESVQLYRNLNTYSRSKLRRVNKKQLCKAYNSVRGRQVVEKKKQPINSSKVLDSGPSPKSPEKKAPPTRSRDSGEMDFSFPREMKVQKRATISVRRKSSLLRSKATEKISTKKQIGKSQELKSKSPEAGVESKPKVISKKENGKEKDEEKKGKSVVLPKTTSHSKFTNAKKSPVSFKPVSPLELTLHETRGPDMSSYKKINNGIEHIYKVNPFISKAYFEREPPPPPPPVSHKTPYQSHTMIQHEIRPKPIEIQDSRGQSTISEKTEPKLPAIVDKWHLPSQPLQYKYADKYQKKVVKTPTVQYPSQTSSRGKLPSSKEDIKFPSINDNRVEHKYANYAVPRLAKFTYRDSNESEYTEYLMTKSRKTGSTSQFKTDG